VEDKSPVISTLDITDTLNVRCPTSQTTPFLEGSMLKILRSEDAVVAMTSVLLKAAKIRIQVGKFGLQNLTVGTTTNTTKIRKCTEGTLALLPLKMRFKKLHRLEQQV
jgi:hypothetical protein